MTLMADLPLYRLELLDEDSVESVQILGQLPHALLHLQVVLLPLPFQLALLHHLRLTTLKLGVNARVNFILHFKR